MTNLIQMPGVKTNPEAPDAEGSISVECILELAVAENFDSVVIIGETSEGSCVVMTDGGTSMNGTNWALDQAKQMLISGKYDVEPADGTE